MAAQVEKDIFIATESLCETCANAVPQLCGFIQNNEPEEALAALGAAAVKTKISQTKCDTIYKVTNCPVYIPGDLPALTESKKARSPRRSDYDLDCPQCGAGENIRVAGMKEMSLSPLYWFCHCGICGKTYNPRKKKEDKMQNEVDILRNENTDLCNENAILGENPEDLCNSARPKTRLEEAREKLSYEEYQKLKKQYLSDKQIGQMFNIRPTVLVDLKKEWGVKIEPIIQRKKEEPAPVVSRLTIAQAIDLYDELEEDMDGLNHILAQSEQVGFSDRLIKLFTWHRDNYQVCRDRLHQVFNKTHVEV